MDKAKNLLLGAVDVMLQLKETKETKKEPTSSSQSSQPTSSGSLKLTSSKQSLYDEHRRLFRYQHSKTYSLDKTHRGWWLGWKGQGKEESAYVSEGSCVPEGVYTGDCP